MRRTLLVIATLACGCSTPVVQPVPGANLGPRFARPPSAACETDIATDETSPIVGRYRYVYDDANRLAHSYGTFTGRNAPISIDYAWDNLDHIVQITETHGTQTPVISTNALYNTLGDLVEYTSGTEHYSYSAFDDDGHPTSEIVRSGTYSATYQLAYDSTGRLSRVTPDEGDPQIYTYDDDARTLTIDTDAGAFHGVITYDEANHELSESYDGTDPSAMASEHTYAWDGARLLSAKYREGTAAAPHALQTLEFDTYRYDCGTR